MNKEYNPAAIEARLQAAWAERDAFRADAHAAPRFYCLSMFPYPSGKLHMGHVRNYTIGDVIARFKRLRGFNVLHPIGWDAFGLPAENAALTHGIAPSRWTFSNIDDMRGQFQQLGLSFDWSREFATAEPSYYRWEQWFFTKLFERGLVYRKTAAVNWDPVDQTVLANEQVVDGKGWRSGAPVERREIAQWFLKITDYAEELLEGLDQLQNWPEAVKAMQRHWIGRSEGLEIAFAVNGDQPDVRVFTTRPDTLFGAAFIAVAPEHPIATEAAEHDPEVASFLDRARRQQATEAALDTAEKEGVRLSCQAIHPLTGEELPVFAANFVLIGYGTGAVMGVPAHDQRDWEFARKYQLDIRQVIEPEDDAAVDLERSAFTDHGVLRNSGEFDGLRFAEAFDAVAEALTAQNRAVRKIQFRLRDWGVSRQRYWGCPIPIILCDSCGAVPVPEDDLPVELPTDITLEGPGSPLAGLESWVQIACPRCGEMARRETDTFDTFVESSWYYARFTAPDNDEQMLDERTRAWLPVDQYIGGIEHAVLHLLYFRFWHKLMRDFGLVEGDEPARALLCQGMVVAETFYREEGKQRTYFAPAEVEVERDPKGVVVAARLREDGLPVTVGPVEKMSKSKNNGVDPQQLISNYGADTVRLYALFAAPPDQALEWSDAGVEGQHRFLKRLWRQCMTHLAQADDPRASRPRSAEFAALRRQLHQTIAKVGDDIDRRLSLNTAIAALMELSNAVGKFDVHSEADYELVRESLLALTVMLAPFAPHVAEELGQQLDRGDWCERRWPTVDEAALEAAEVTVVIQVNGKLRGKVSLPPGSAKESVQAAAVSDENVERFIAGKEIRKVVYVPDKLINLVVAA